MVHLPSSFIRLEFHRNWHDVKIDDADNQTNHNCAVCDSLICRQWTFISFKRVTVTQRWHPFKCWSMHARSPLLFACIAISRHWKYFSCEFNKINFIFESPRQHALIISPFNDICHRFKHGRSAAFLTCAQVPRFDHATSQSEIKMRSTGEATKKHKLKGVQRS